MLFSTPILDMVIVMKAVRTQGAGYSLISAVYVFAVPKGMVYGPFWWSEDTLSIFVWNRVWFSRNLWECTCTNVFIVFTSR